MDTQRTIKGIARRWWLLLPLALIGGFAGYAGSSRIQPVYEATTSVLVGQIFEDSNVSKDYIESTQSLTDTYGDLARRQPILEGVAKDLKLRAPWTNLRERVRVILPPSNPQLISITVEADSPEDAVTIANEIATRLVAESPTNSEGAAATEVKGFVQSQLDSLQQDILGAQRELNRLRVKRAIAPREARRDLRIRMEAKQRLLGDWQNNYSSLLGALAAEQSPNSLRVLETASASGDPVRPDVPFNTALGAGAGLLLAMGLAYILEFRKDRSGSQSVRPVSLPAEEDADSPERPNEYRSASAHLRE